MFKLIYIFCCLIVIAGCSHEKIILEKFDISPDAQIDTIGGDRLRNIFLVKIKEYGHLGNYENQYVFLKKSDGQNKFAYKIKNRNIEARLSKRYVSFVDGNNKDDYGWFHLRNHQIDPFLPKVDSITSCLRMRYPGMFVQETNGYFSIIKNDSLITSLNYGSFFLDKEINLNNLQFGVYKLKNRNLYKLSDNGNKLIEQNDGVYFVPPPGFHVIENKDLKTFYLEIDSIDIGGKLPTKIEINEM